MASSATRHSTERAAQARRLAGSVLDHIKDAPDDAGVGAKARVLRAMCGHLDALAKETSQCCGADCMGRRTDGFSFWVPHAQLAAETARANGLHDENNRLRAALFVIAEGEGSGGDWMDQLVADSQSLQQRWRDLATIALAGAAR